MKIPRRPITVILIATLTVLCVPISAQNGVLNCASNDGRYHYCRADTQNRVRLVQQFSNSPCNQGYSWGFDYRGVWVDRGCRAQFEFGRRNSGGNTGAAVAAGVIGAIMIPDLLDNRFDLIISGFSMSTNRAMQVNFSAPYNYTDLSLAANRKLAGGFKELAEFNKSTVTIGVLDTSTAVDIASNAFPNAQLKTYAEDSDLFNDLLEDKIYAAVADSPRPQIVAKLFPEKVDVPSSKALATFPAAFAVRRGDMDFINYLNSWIEARTVNKWLERRRNYWFGSMDWADRL